MDKLSERLEAHFETLRLAKIGCKCLNNGADAPILDKLDALKKALTEAAKLARRMEEAPVGHVDQAVAADAVVVDELDLSDWRLRGQRVRLVREE